MGARTTSRVGVVVGLAIGLLGGPWLAAAQEHAGHTMGAPPAAAGQEHAGHGVDASRLGTVHFETSCRPDVAAAFDHAAALLHSFWFDAAIDAFNGVLAKDEGCAMTQWGVALALWGNPLAGVQSPKVLERGWATIEKARAIRAGSERERDYIEAAAELYKDAASVPQPVRRVNYEQAMDRVRQKYPQDTEATIFYAMALVATQSPEDKTYAKLLKAADILDPLFKQQPDHPGIAHYIIHAYDVPPLAPRALEAARRYAKIAPDAPHALHMPSHTFTRLGYWQESIDTNIASAESARRAHSPGDEFHASDYLVYAYLQAGQDMSAKRVLDAVAGAFSAQVAAQGAGGALASYGLSGTFAMTAMPARYALERGQWKDAAALVPRQTPLPYADALTHFARALGAARGGGDLAAAREDATRLAALEDTLTGQKNTYWAGQVEIQRRSAEAWILLAEGRKEEALAAMRAAAQMEGATEKSALTPGPIAPAQELLGEMLLQAGQPAEALAAFEASSKKEPNRFRGVYGAARAAQAAGATAKAREYYAQLVSVCAKGDVPGRPELAEARAFLQKAGQAASR